MQARTSPPATKCSISAFLLFICLLCLPTHSFCQSILKFANLADGQKVTSYDAVLSNPQFLCAPGWEVLTFTLSFQPKGKEYYGPYVTKGPKLTEKRDRTVQIFQG